MFVGQSFQAVLNGRVTIQEVLQRLEFSVLRGELLLQLGHADLQLGLSRFLADGSFLERDGHGAGLRCRAGLQRLHFRCVVGQSPIQLGSLGVPALALLGSKGFGLGKFLLQGRTALGCGGGFGADLLNKRYRAGFVGANRFLLALPVVQFIRLAGNRLLGCRQLAAGVPKLLVSRRQRVAQLIGPVGGDDRRLKRLPRFSFQPLDVLQSIVQLGLQLSRLGRCKRRWHKRRGWRR